MCCDSHSGRTSARRSDAARKGWITRRANLVRVAGLVEEATSVEFTAFVIAQPTVADANTQKEEALCATPVG